MPHPSNNTFCTIITQAYWPYALAVYEGLQKQHPGLNFSVLVVDAPKTFLKNPPFPVHLLSDVKKTYPTDYLRIAPYETDPGSRLRWALKPLYIKYLLEVAGYKKVIFTDPDTYYYNPVDFVWDFLDQKDICLTPHWRSIEPDQDPSNFSELMTGGLFNAGFVTCNQNATDILDWWLRACAFKMDKQNGFYVDQAYLNLLTVYFPERLHTITHKGCNLANWNRLVCKRENHNGQVLINGTDPVVFIHFTQATIHFIENGKDVLLSLFLEEYRKVLDDILKTENLQKQKTKKGFRDYFKNILQKN